ncbi:MAG: noncanonical pyrimidine nucleotidase, YjjG family [Flavobacteriales bacterium]|nr:noncanonical pyrimidine nucleotidase, YjjG family [Flavobacteriales bacterium]
MIGLKQIKHVFFDLDRTLWDFETNSEATLKELFAEFKLTEKLGVSADAFIKEYKRINELFWNDYRTGTIKKEELRYARFEAALRFFDHEDSQMAADIGEQYIWRSPRKTALVDGTIEVLEYLRPKYNLHIITNGFEEVQHIKMTGSGLDPYFIHQITSEAAGARKPSIQVFEYAQDLTGARADNSIMIGDHLEADVEGALNAGWKAVFFEPNRSRITDQEFLHIIHLSELKDIL